MQSFPTRDYLGSYNQASRTTAQKLAMRAPDPVTKDPVSAGIEGAIGGGLAAASAIGAMGAMGGGENAGAETKTPGVPGKSDYAQHPQSALTPEEAGAGSPIKSSGLSKFFNFFNFGGAQG